MDLSFIDKYGWCRDCEKWVKLLPDKNWLPEHDDNDGKICKNSKYSHGGMMYYISSPEQAKKLAEIISQDNNICLKSGGHHSMACGDGRDCEAKRTLMAKALAFYTLNPDKKIDEVKPPLSIIDIVENVAGLYEGDLRHYFRVIVLEAQNTGNPYHNLRHMLHVMWVCYQACLYYQNILGERQMRNLLIAAMLHDFDHSGMFGDDDTNIIRAIRGLEKYADSVDRPFVQKIASLISNTEYPHVFPSEEISLSAQILRDADLSQALSSAWYQQCLIGFSKEWNKSLPETLKMQISFFENIDFITEWAKHYYSKEMIQEKIHELQRVLKTLES